MTIFARQIEREMSLPIQKKETPRSEGNLKFAFLATGKGSYKKEEEVKTQIIGMAQEWCWGSGKKKTERAAKGGSNVEREGILVGQMKAPGEKNKTASKEKRWCVGVRGKAREKGGGVEVAGPHVCSNQGSSL